MPSFRRLYLSIDPRTLGLARIAIALLLLLDLAKRTSVIDVFYTNEGLIPNHRVLWRPPREFTFSFLLSLSQEHEVILAFLLIALVYLCLLVGYRTRSMHVLSWLCLLSLELRVDLLSNGADFVFSDLVLWTAFLPLGRRFSLDALLSRLRAGDEPDTTSPSPVAPTHEDTQPVVSLAVLAATVQLCVIYVFNAIHKTGATWRDGSAVYWLVHQERIVTVLGLWARKHLPLTVFQSLSYGTLVVEGALPLLILSPWGRPFTRRAAVLAIFGLHTGIAMLSNLGLFSPVMMVFSLLLIEAEDWDALERRVSGSGRLRRHLERATFVCWQLARFVDGLGTYGRVPRAHAPGSWGSRLSIARGLLRELMVSALIIVATSQLLIENPAIPPFFKHEQPTIIHAGMDYFRLNQGWSMFAPDAPTSDSFIVIDAVTVDGRHVDPFNLLASRIADPSLRRIPERLGQSAAYCDYAVRIANAGIYHDPLRDWIMSYHLRTDRPNDRIVRFQAYIIEQDSPRPTERAPRNVRARVFLSS